MSCPLLCDEVLGLLVSDSLHSVEIRSDTLELESPNTLTLESSLEDYEVTHDVKDYGVTFTHEAVQDEVFDADTVVFTKTRLTVYNPCGYNDDSRSHREEPDDWEDPYPDFEYSRDCPGGVTLRNVLELVFMVKGSKHDYWYELFSSLKSSVTGDTVLITTEFCHGS